MRHYLAAMALAAVSATSANAATFQFFNDRDSFDAVAGDLISFDLSASNSLLSVTGDDVTVVDDVLFDVIDQDDAPDTVFSFGLPLFGFGADFDTSPVGPGSGITVTVSFGDDSIVLGEGVPSPFDGGFWGFLSDTAIDAISFSEGPRSARPQETYTLTNPTGALNIAEVAPVPLPAGLPLMFVGLGAFALLRRRQMVPQATT